MNRTARALLVLAAGTGLTLTASPALAAPPDDPDCTEVFGGTYCNSIDQDVKENKNKTKTSTDQEISFDGEDTSYEIDYDIDSTVDSDGDSKYRQRTDSTSTIDGTTSGCKSSYTYSDRASDDEPARTKSKQSCK